MMQPWHKHCPQPQSSSGSEGDGAGCSLDCFAQWAQQEQLLGEVLPANASKTPKHRNGQRPTPVKTISVIAIRNIRKLSPADRSIAET